jgi:amino acid permease
MRTPREGYARLLHGAIGATTAFLGVFGIMGFLRFRVEGIQQIATENLPIGSLVGGLVRSCMVVAILCTYPLQLFPVIESVEGWLLGAPERYVPVGKRAAAAENKAVDGSGRSTSSDDNAHTSPLVPGLLGQSDASGDEDAALKRRNLVRVGFLGSGALAVLRAAGVPLTAAGEFDALELFGPIAGRCLWKTALLRVLLVLATSFTALVAADYYGYIASVVGAAGATTLSFIMPCLLHLHLYRGELSAAEQALDMGTAALGFVSGVVGLAVTFKQWVS